MASPKSIQSPIFPTFESLLRGCNLQTEPQLGKMTNKQIDGTKRLLLLGHRSLIKNNTQTAVINIINLRIIYKLDVSYASQHTFSKVTVTIFFDNYIYI